MSRQYQYLPQVILGWIEAFGVVDKRLLLLLVGKTRVKCFETLLPRLEREGKVKVKRFKGRKVYALKKRELASLEHDITALGCGFRLWRARPEAEIIPKKMLMTYPFIPDFGLTYRGRKLFVEYSTPDNGRRVSLLKAKITRYLGQDGLVVFILDLPRTKVEELALRELPGSNFYFVDYQTFISLPLGEHMKASIYFWGGDGRLTGLQK